MNKVFIGLLIIAAGAGAFFYLRKKDSSTSADNIKKEWIVGKWKIETLQPGKDSANNFMVGIMGLVDSNTLKYQYEFTKEGNILRSLGDSVNKDSSLYEWDKKNELIWKENKSDSIGSVLAVTKLNKNNLQLQTTDSTLIFLKKLK